MTTKHTQPQHFSGGITVDTASGSSESGAITPVAGVLVTKDRMLQPRHVRLTLTNLALAIAAADDFGSVKIVDLPDTNLVLLGIEANLELVKGEVTNGLEAATDMTVAIGTAAASNATLSGAMVDVVTGIALTATDASPAFQIHSVSDATLNYPIELADSATLALYLNLAALITADDALTISGTIDLYLVDVGNSTS